MKAASGPPLRVVLIGPESTGKTTLARELAAHFDVPWSPEFARAFVEETGRPVRFEDVGAIGRGQLANEDGARRLATDLVILDTDLVSTWVYSQHYFGACPPWILEAARARLADVYLLLGTDVAWIPEDHMREAPERREELHELFRETLTRLGAHVVDVRGNWAERRAAALREVGRRHARRADRVAAREAGAGDALRDLDGRRDRRGAHHRPRGRPGSDGVG